MGPEPNSYQPPFTTFNPITSPNPFTFSLPALPSLPSLPFTRTPSPPPRPPRAPTRRNPPRQAGGATLQSQSSHPGPQLNLAGVRGGSSGIAAMLKSLDLTVMA